MTVTLDGKTLTIEDVVRVSRRYERIELRESAREKIAKSREVLDELIKSRIIYGINTGFGALSNTTIPPEDIEKLQLNLIRSHSTGIGPALPTDVTRAMMLLRANTLAKGLSGIRLPTLETLVAMINSRVHPIIPERGSVGASGDLAPLAHLALTLIGEGCAEYQGKGVNSSEALKAASISPVQLAAKEGLALINGTQMMTAIGALMVHDARNLIDYAERSGAVSLEVLEGLVEAFDDRLHQARPHPGQTASARHMMQLLHGSKLVSSGEERVLKGLHRQDPYSLRCIPQVMGAVRDSVEHASSVIEIELNSANDNPLIFSDDRVVLSGGNFHGQPIAIVLDLMCIALTTVGNLVERRINRLLDQKLSLGLPPFLVSATGRPGLSSGLMTTQCSAAALASENKILSHPASVDSIPTSADFEDFVSMGPAAALKLMRVVENVRFIVAIELICASQAVETRGAENLSSANRSTHMAVRRLVQRLEADREVSGDINRLAFALREGDFVRAS
ncbi:histidine ammonia-lyase [Candidatus Bathyarchaeota archaeon]|jgi:histidine ammonia-lyase|nr:histidine ammonia-lyase [Candidatus Bathyarchaeota archaeon]